MRNESNEMRGIYIEVGSCKIIANWCYIDQAMLAMPQVIMGVDGLLNGYDCAWKSRNVSLSRVINRRRDGEFWLSCQLLSLKQPLPQVATQSPWDSRYDTTEKAENSTLKELWPDGESSRAESKGLCCWNRWSSFRQCRFFEKETIATYNQQHRIR